ncbi:MAG: hypothetical protein HYR50_06840 [Candidatus Rokubacteria bacterium]|nr:hypothetical protein [Candidatus Rokubacteria bacterium]
MEGARSGDVVFDNYVALSNQATLSEAMALADRLGIPRQAGLWLELAAAAGAKTAVRREAWKLCGQAWKAGLGRLGTLGSLGSWSPSPESYLPSLISRLRRWR